MGNSDSHGDKLISRSNYWKNSYKRRVSDHYILSEYQKKEIISFYGSYQDLF